MATEIARYNYVDPETGEILAVKVRYEPKTFVWETTGDDGVNERDLPLYNAHLLSGRRATHAVFFVEGEKAADALYKQMNVSTVCLPGGAGTRPTTKQLAMLRDKTVVLWPDNDAPGRALMRRIYEKLQKVIGNGKIRCIYPADVPGKGDPYDWLQLGHTKEDLREEFERNPVDTLLGKQISVINLSGREAQEIDWLLRPYIPRKMMTLFEGPKGTGKCIGKETLCLDVETGHFVTVAGLSDIQLSLDENSLRLISQTGTITDQGEQEIYRLVTRSGREVFATAQHPFYTRDGWKKLSELSDRASMIIHQRSTDRGDMIASAARIDVTSPVHEDIGNMWLLGALVGDGHLEYRPGRGRGVSFCAYERTILDAAIEEATKFPNTKCKPSVDLRGSAGTADIGFIVQKEIGTTNTLSGLQYWLMERALCTFARSEQKELPSWTAGLTQTATAALVAGLIDTDGSITKGAISFGSTSKKLVQQMSLLFARLGIVPSGYREKPYPERFAKTCAGKMSYGITVTQYDASKLARILLPYLKSNKRKERCRRLIDQSFIGQFPTRDGEIFWDEIYKIEPAGIDQTYDWSFKGHHSFLACGIIAHNTWLTLKLAAMVSTGKFDFPVNPYETEPAKALFLAHEDPIDEVLVPRLLSMGANMNNVRVISSVIDSETGEEEWFDLKKHVELLYNLLLQDRYSLLVIDPINNYINQNVDTYRDSDIRAVLSPIAKMAEETGISVIGIRHFKKAGASLSEMGLGSVGYANIARVVHAIVPDADDILIESLQENGGALPTNGRSTVMLPVVLNIAESPRPVGFKVVVDGIRARFEWNGTRDYTAEEYVEAIKKKKSISSTRHERKLVELEEFVANPETNVLSDADVAERFGVPPGLVELTRYRQNTGKSRF